MVELIWEDAGVLRRMSGVVTAEELDTTAVALQADERVDRLRYIIHDFSAATEITLSQDDVEFMAVRASVALLRNPGVRIAFVGDHPVVHALIDAFNSQGYHPISATVSMQSKKHDVLRLSQTDSAGSHKITSLGDAAFRGDQAPTPLGGRAHGPTTQKDGNRGNPMVATGPCCAQRLAV